MGDYIVYGGNKLYGEVIVPRAKNACLPLLAGAILCDGIVVIKDIPHYSDISVMCRIMQSFGAIIDVSNEQYIIDCRNIHPSNLEDGICANIRSSILFLGAMISRQKCVAITYPGGCDIGTRPIDLHLLGLRAMNCCIEDKHGVIRANGHNYAGGTFHLDFPSVGATENLILAATLQEGKVTKIINPAREPEIVDLACFINQMGGKVFGAGSNEIVIFGVKKLHGTEYHPIGDRIFSGSIILSTVMTGGEVVLKRADIKHNEALIKKIVQSSCQIEGYNDKIIVKAKGRPLAIQKIETLPFPGFPTDLQPQIVSMLSMAKGTSIVVENLFENRFRYTSELTKMGAEIVVKDRTAVIHGVKKLFGATVAAPDLRGGMGLIMAGLVAEGYTRIKNTHYIKRGYEHIDRTLVALGAKIITDEKKGIDNCS